MPKTTKKKADLNTRMGRYLLAKSVAKTKEEAMRIAGYSHQDTPQRIEKTQTYKLLEKTYYKDELLRKMTLEEIADEQIKVIKQDKELSAKNKAIEMALKKIEPEDNVSDVTNNVMIVLG